MEVAVGMLIGWALCYFTVAYGREKKGDVKQEVETLVKRVKPSLRNPMRTTRTEYDKYKSKDTGLYEPVKPKVASKEEIELGR